MQELGKFRIQGILEQSRVWGLCLAAAFGCDSQADPQYVGEALIELGGHVDALSGSEDDADVGVLWLTGSASDGCSGPYVGCSVSSSGAFSPDADFECAAACEEPASHCEDPDAYQAWAECQTSCGLPTEVSVQIQSRTCFEGGVAQTTPVDGEFPAAFNLDVLQPPPGEALMPSDTGERVAIGLFVAVDPSADSMSFSRRDRERPAWLLGGSETHVLIYVGDPVSEDSTWGRHLGGAYAEGYHLVKVRPGNRCGLPRYEEAASGGSSSNPPDKDFDSRPGDAMSAGDAAAPEQQSEWEGPDYEGVALVCGNGVCEPGESCSVCSDCVECDDDDQHGKSSGLTNRETDEFFCTSTAGKLVPAEPGSERDIELLIARPEYIDWPPI